MNRTQIQRAAAIHDRHAYRQRGAALVISLMILIVMTLIGITGMSTSSLEEKMAGNSRDRALAFQAAEAALREAEGYYEGTIVSIGAAFDGTNAGLYPAGSSPDIYDDATWANSRTYSGAIDGVAEQPAYIIELLGEVGDTSDDLNVSNYGESSGVGDLMAARVTARGVGGTDDTEVFLQTTYGKWN